jgi:hypothetical protein
MNKKLAADFAKSLLFENKLEEKFQPDVGTMDQFKRGRQIYDRPGPSLESEIELSNIEDSINMPLTADDMMTTQLTSVKVDSDKLMSPKYTPKNSKELNSAIASLIDDIELGDKDVEVLWHGVRKFLSKKA